MKKLFALSFSMFTLIFAHAQIVMDQATAEQAVQELLGEGVTATNITFSGAAVQLGILSGAEGTIFAPTAGVVLSCGDVENLENDLGGDVPFGEGVSGDPDLLEIANDVPPLIGQTFSVGSVNDIATLEFDFVPSGDSLKFNYSFGSDEYLTWVNSSFNDIFGFFLSGPGITGPYNAPPEFPDGAINIAQVPDSDPLLPITISSVNNVLNSEYYIDNPGNTDININGFTTVITAEAAVECGQTYHIKLAIADGTDTALESIVCIEAGSFQSSVLVSATVPDAPPTLPDATMLEGCVDGIFTLFRPNLQSSDTLFLDISGTADETIDYEDLPEFIVFDEESLIYELPITTIFNPEVEDLETVIISYTSESGCGDQDTIFAQLDILDYVEPSLELPEEIFLCNGANQNVSAQPQDGYAPFIYNWSTGESTQSIVASSDSPSPVSVIVTDYCENETSDQFEIVLPAPFLILDEVELCFGGTTSNLASGGANPYTYIYSEDSLELNGNFFTPLYPGIYEVEIIDECGESGTSVLDIPICETVVPNVFSPNGDSVNDSFVIQGNLDNQGNRLVVYNRWGTLVYESDDYNNNWQGDEVADGVYYYIYTRYDGEEYTGEVQIIRGQ